MLDSSRWQHPKALIAFFSSALLLASFQVAQADYPDGYAQGYIDAVDHSMGSGSPDYRPDPAGAVDDLTVIADTNTELIWQGGSPAPQGHVLMAMFTDYSGYDINYTDSTYRHTVWTSAAPELCDFLRSNEIPAGNIAERTKQLLGMPSSHSGDRVVEVWVRRDNLRRPCRNPDVANPVSSLEFPADVDTNYPGHRAEFLGNMSTYSTAGGNTPYPWTQLGYTYDWGNPETNRGLTEFWVGGYDDTDASTIAKTQITVYSVFSIGSYPYWNRNTLDFDVTADCDTIWAGATYVPTDLENRITVRRGATVYQGILVSSAGYNLTNYGTITGPGRNPDRTFRAAVVRFEMASELHNQGSISGQIGFEALQGDQQVNNYSGATIRGTQYAVKLAAGDDLFYNNGIVEGNVDMGAGDDFVFLRNGAVTGDIDGGTDTDTLSFSPDTGTTARLTGNVVGFELVQIFSGRAELDGSTDGNVQVTSGATLAGNARIDGDLQNDGNVAPGHSIGTIEVAGNYIQSTNAELEVELAKPTEGLTDCDRLMVAGDATFASGSVIRVSHSPGDRVAFRVGDWFPIVTAVGTITDQGAQVRCDSAFLEFTGGVWGANYTVTASHKQDFADVATNANDLALARALDADAPTAVNEFGGLVNDLLFMTESEFQDSAGRLSPGVYLAARAAGFRTSQFIVEGLADRMRRRRVGFRRGEVPDGYYATSAEPSRARSWPLPITRGQNHTESPLFYFRPFGLFFHESAGEQRIGFQANSPGVDIGLEQQLGRGCFGGITFAYADTDIHFSRGLGTGDLDVLRVGPYVSLVHNDWFLDASATYGYHDNGIKRHVNVGSIAEVAEGRYHANDFSMYFGLGRFVGSPQHAVSPVASIQYLYFDQPGFAERSAPASALTVGPRGAHSLRSRVGLESSSVACLGGFELESDLSAGWAHEYLNDESLPARLTAGTTSFETQRLVPYRDSGYFAAGLTLRRGRRLSLSCRYTGELSNHGSFHAVDVGLMNRY